MDTSSHFTLKLFTGLLILILNTQYIAFKGLILRVNTNSLRGIIYFWMELQSTRQRRKQTLAMYPLRRIHDIRQCISGRSWPFLTNPAFSPVGKCKEALSSSPCSAVSLFLLLLFSGWTWLFFFTRTVVSTVTPPMGPLGWAVCIRCLIYKKYIYNITFIIINKWSPPFLLVRHKTQQLYNGSVLPG